MTKYETDYEGLAELAEEVNMSAEERLGLFAFVDGTDDSSFEDIVYDKLYELYWQDMPYGTAKARDGDPYEWISEKLFNDYVTKVEN